MSTSLETITSDVTRLDKFAQFIELQIHDSLQGEFDTFKSKALLPEDFDGYLTLHGEGETDGKKKIKFSYSDERDRREYISNCINLYDSVICNCSDRVRRIILHPDTLSAKTPREMQIQQLATSLVEIKDHVQGVDICIEPRGGNNQGKVLRAYLEDILILEQCLALNEGKSRKIGLCTDIAQVVVVHGNTGALRFLEQLKSSSTLPVLEFHASDVALNQNRVAVEIGKGRVDWASLLPVALSICNNVLIETLGGVKVFQRSKDYLESLVKNTHEVLL